MESGRKRDSLKAAIKLMDKEIHELEMQRYALQEQLEEFKPSEELEFLQGVIQALWERLTSSKAGASWRRYGDTITLNWDYRDAFEVSISLDAENERILIHLRSHDSYRVTRKGDTFDDIWEKEVEWDGVCTTYEAACDEIMARVRLSLQDAYACMIKSYDGTLKTLLNGQVASIERITE